MSSTSGIRVVVKKAPNRKGWLWQQVARNGMVGAVSPKTYDTQRSALRSANRQAELLDWVPVIRADA